NWTWKRSRCNKPVSDSLYEPFCLAEQQLAVEPIEPKPGRHCVGRLASDNVPGHIQRSTRLVVVPKLMMRERQGGEGGCIKMLPMDLGCELLEALDGFLGPTPAVFG